MKKNANIKVKFSLGKKIFLFVIFVIALISIITYTSTLNSLTKSMENEFKIRGISISKGISSSLSSTVSSIIASKYSKNPQDIPKIFQSPKLISEIFSDLPLREEYINLLETFKDIPKTEDIIWAAVVDINGKIVVHSREDVSFGQEFVLPKNTFNHEILMFTYYTILSNLDYRKESFSDTLNRLVEEFLGNVYLDMKIKPNQLSENIKKNFPNINPNLLGKLIDLSLKIVYDNQKDIKEKFIITYWNIKEIQRKYIGKDIENEFRNAVNQLFELKDYLYIDEFTAKKKFNVLIEFLRRTPEISIQDKNTIKGIIEQFLESSFGTTGFLQYYYEKVRDVSFRRILFSFPIFISDDPEKYVGNLYINMSTESITKAMSSSEREIQIGVLIGLLVGIVFIIFLSRSLSKNANTIVSSMQKLSEGDLKVRAYLKTNDEFKFIADNFNIMVSQIEEKEKMRDIMNKVVSEEIARELMDKGIELGGELRFTTMLFSDIRGFTSMSEKMDPRTLISILNEYMTEMVEIVKKYKGVVDKFVGDEIMVVYGAPITFGKVEDALLAVTTAYNMIKRMEYLHQKWASENKPLLTPGIGINSGDVVAGNMGSKDRLSYTVIGDAVNTAARLCGAAAGMNCIISHNTFSLIREFINCEELEPIKVKGKSEPLKIYRVLSINQLGERKIQEILGNGKNT